MDPDGFELVGGPYNEVAHRQGQMPPPELKRA
jgi:hypothetical protein